MQTWSDFANVQPLASKIILNSIAKNRLSHAYLFQGGRGSGKKSLAKLLTMTLFCNNVIENNPCLTCNACKRVNSGNHPDVHWIEPDGATIKNEQIDHLRKEFSFTSVESSRKVYIINKSDTLTTHAANRILKFLEEPNVTSTAILLTEHAQAILPTIRSRCQLIDLQPLNEELFKEKLFSMQLDNLDENKARLLSALTYNLDEAIEYHKEENIYHIQQLVKSLIELLIDNYHERYLFVHRNWMKELKDKQEQELGIELLLIACRDIVQAKIENNHSLVFFNERDPLLQKAIIHFTENKLLQMIKFTLDAKRKLAQHVHPTLTIEQLILEF